MKGKIKMTDFEIAFPDLHELFIAGGQVHIYPPTLANEQKSIKSSVVFPDGEPYNEELSNTLITQVQTLGENYPYITVDDLSKKLDITYRAAIELTKKARVGGIRTAKGYKIYPPSITSYLERLPYYSKREWFDA